MTQTQDADNISYCFVMLLSYYIGGKKGNIINCIKYIAEKGRQTKGKKRLVDPTTLHGSVQEAFYLAKLSYPSGKICRIYSVFRWKIEQFSLNSLYLEAL